MSKIEEWGIAQDLIDLQARGISGKPAARQVLPKIEAWAARTGQPVPNIEAIGKAISRYFSNPAADGRSKQARMQKAAEVARTEYRQDLAERQVDAIGLLENQVVWASGKLRQVDGILGRMEEALKAEGGRLSPGDLRDAAVVAKAFSSEFRGWLELMVDVKDRLMVHQQYEHAFREILVAIMTEAPDRAPAIAARLRAIPAVAAALRNRAVEGAIM